jgi:putative phosphoribosyl transferase
MNEMDLNRSLIDSGLPLLPAQLTMVAGAQGLVVLTQGDKREAANNSSLAVRLQRHQLHTLVMPLLTPEEAAESPARPHEVELLSKRLLQAVDSLGSPPQAGGHELSLGLMASDADAAAAVVVAAQRPQVVRATVLRGARLDLVADVLGDLRSPTLLLVGAADPEMLDIGRKAFARLGCEKRIDVVPRASRLFREAGTLDVVAQRAGDWLATHLRAA